MAKKLIVLVFLAMTFFSVYPQQNHINSFNMDWRVKSIFLDEKTSIKLPVVNEFTVDLERKLPLFTSSWRVSENSVISKFELTNIIYEVVSKSDLGDIQIENIPTKLEKKLEIISTRNEFDAFFQLVPIINDGNQIKRILSFQISYDIQPNNFRLNGIKNTTNSVLAYGKWYKFAVDTTGVYKIDRNFLSNLGINISNINPKNIQIFGNGGALLPYKIGDARPDDLLENAIYVFGEEDLKFDNNDYILFYAKGPESWTHNQTPSSLKHIKNIYSDKAYYFIHIAGTEGKRIQNATEIKENSNVIFQNFDDYWVYEKDLRNLFSAGQQWFGESFDVQNQRIFTHTFSNVDTSFPLIIKTRVASISQTATNFQLSLNGNTLTSISLMPTSGYTLATSAQNTTSTSITQENLNISLTYNNNGNSAAKAYLDYIEIIGKKKLITGNKQFSFRNFAAYTTSGILGYQIQNTANIFQLWDVTNPYNPMIIKNQGNGNLFEFKATGNQLREYIVLNEQNFFKPTKPTDFNVENQNLHNLSDVDYLIITKNDFIVPAETLAQYHRTTSGLNVKVIPLHQIYNEFSSGLKDITAIRDFVRHIYLNSNQELKYLLLFGDASFDFKSISNQSENIVPSFESFNSFDMTNSFVTDDFFGIVSDANEGDLDATSFQTIDVAVSRIPFNTYQEAQQITSKILNYYAVKSYGDWRNDILMIADDTDVSTDEILQISQESLADDIKLNKPQVNVKKVWIDAYKQEVLAGGSRYPQVNESINSSIEKGTLFVDYFGHGGEDGLTLERIVETSQISSWKNLNALNLFTVISCEFARFDNPLRPNTAGELLIRNPNGGAAHLIATAREIFINVGLYYNQNLIPRLLDYNGNSTSISENLRIAKNTNFNPQRFFIFSFGDPAMKLALPKPNIKLTHMNGVSVLQSLDTIKALSKITFDGIITDDNDLTNTGFNGEVYLTVFDKPMDKQTLNNDGNAQLMTFDTQDSKIFRGRALVKNGQFHIEFVAPLDLRIANGKGKLSFYAQDTRQDRGGYNTDIVIGGINYDAASDQTGPEIKLFMNDTSFLDGGNTNQSPLFLAFLKDENGINTSFSSVDHDITAILDDDQQNPFVLNDYYITNVNDYTTGSLEFRLRDLTVGPHSIKLKAFDTYNNPSESTLNFVVVDDAKLMLEHVLNYPNPFVNYTQFWFSHNKPNEPLEIQIQIFTISGKLVKTITQTVQNAGSLSRDITWDGLDDFGDKIGKGVYIYKLSARAVFSNLKSEKFEKLVILQ